MAATATIALKVLDERIRPYLPAYATPGSAGMDLRACIDAPLTLRPGQTELIATGIASTSRIRARGDDPARSGLNPRTHRVGESRRTDRLGLPGR